MIFCKLWLANRGEGEAEGGAACRKSRCGYIAHSGEAVRRPGIGAAVSTWLIPSGGGYNSQARFPWHKVDAGLFQYPGFYHVVPLP